MGYHPESSDESAKHSNSEHHANYKPSAESTDPEDVPIVYQHRDNPVLSKLMTGEEGASWQTLVPALIADGEHPTSGYTETAEPISINAGHTKYSVLSNNIDKVNVTLEVEPPENCVLDRLEISDSNGKFTTSAKCEYDYEVLGSVDEKVLTYYFRRPTIEVFTNNASVELGSEYRKGTIKVVSGDENSSVSSDEVIVAESSDYSRSTQYDAGKVLKLIAVPEPGYYVSEVRCGSPLKNNGDIPLVPGDSISDYGEGGAKLITLRSFEDKLLRVVVNFRKIEGETYVPLTVSQFIISSDGSVTPIDTGVVVINGTHDDASVSNTLVSGGQASNTIRLENASMLNADVYVGTQLSLKPTAPTGYALATDTDFFDEGVTGTPNIPIDAFYTEGASTVNVTYTQSGVSYNLDNDNSGESVVKDGRSITVNIYYYPPTFDVKYVDTLLNNPEHTDRVAFGENTVINTPEGLGWNHNGYEFLGWEASPATTEYIKDPGSTITVTSDVTFTAKWRANQFTVKYVDPTCGNADATESVAYNEKTNVKSVDDLHWNHTGYTFTGWTANPSSYSATVGDEITVKEDVTYTATWTKNSYTVKYVDPTCGNTDATESVAYNEKTTVKSVDDLHWNHTGYTFTGWTANPTSYSATVGDEITVKENVTYTATWTKNSYTVKYVDPTCGNADATESVAYNEKTTVKSVDDLHWNHDGYTFTGWTANPSSYSATVGDEITVKENVTYTATWTKNSYTVKYVDPTCGNADATESVAYNGKTVIKTPEQLNWTHDGYTFEGWTPSPATLEYLKDAGNEITVVSDVTFTARWAAISYKVVYVYDGNVPDSAEAVPTDETVYHYGDDVTVKSKPTVPDDYSFSGWLLGNDVTTGFTIGADTPATGNTSPFIITLTGRWTKGGEVSIIYTSGVPENEIDNDSLRNTRTDTCVIGENYTVKPNEGWTDYVRSGYLFKGWQVRQSAMPSPAVTPGARFAASGEAAPLRQSASGFYPEGSVIEGVSEDITFEAVWEKLSTPDPEPEPTFKVTYYANGSTGGSAPVDSKAYGDGGIVTVLEKGDLVKAGSTFVEWNTKADGSGTGYAPGKTFRINGGDVELFAIWKADEAKPGSNSPGTGESAMLIVMAAFAMAASTMAAGAVYIRFRRKRGRADV